MYPLLKKPREIIINPENAGLVIEVNDKRLVTQINHTAASILELCDGSNNIDEIATKMAKKYSENFEVALELVTEFIRNSELLHTVSIYKDKQSQKKIRLFGSTSYWTPSVISIELTYQCPLLCKHCYREANMEYSNYISLTDINKIADDMKQLGIMYVQLTGGEPLIHPDIIDIIRIFSEKDIMISIVTSGYISKKRLITEFITRKNRIATIQVSIDGLEETHNEIRQKKDSYKRALLFIKKLVKNDIPIDVGTSIIYQEKEEIFELSKVLKDLKIKRHRLGMVMNAGRSQKNNLKLTKPTEVAKWTKEFNGTLGTKNFQVIEDEELVSNTNGKKRCGAGYQIIRISPNMVLYPCPILDFPMYNYNEGSLIDFIEKKSIKFYEISVPDSNLCNRCELLDICFQCPAQAMLEKSKVSDCSWYSLEKENFDALII